MKKINLVFILLLTTFCIFKSQTLEDNVLQKKVKTSNTNNVGKVDLNIPLYDINIPGYSFSASLDYLQEQLIGEVLKNETTIVGTNWNLNSTGKIVISNASLENVRSPQRSNLSPNGFHAVGYNNCLIPQTTSSVSKKQILDNPNANLTSYNPNIFYFDFMGNKGYFVYDNVGKFLVYSENDVFQITYNGSKCHNVFSPINEFPEIVIKDSEGNEFYFGGDYNSTDVHYYKNKYDYHNWYDDGTIIHSVDFFTNKHVNFLSTLYLKKIKLVNNKIIDFFYKNSNRSILDSFTNGGVYINADYSSSANIPANNILLNNNIFFGGVSNISYTDSNTPNSGTYTVAESSTYSKFAILDSIKISDIGTLNFSYVQLNNVNTKPFLKKIELKNNNKIVRKIDFDYNTQGNYTYLKTLTLNEDVYNFDYYDYNFSISPNGGLLKKITYPTKGWDEFVYENNSASKVHTIYSGYNESEAIVDKNPPISVPGERIKEIRTFNDANATPLTRKYNYSGDNGILSSGIASANYEIQYSKVTEEIEGKERNEYYFTDIITNPDSIATKKYTDNPNLNLSNKLNNKLPIKISKSNERGKVYKTVKFNSDNAVTLTQNIKYTNFLNNANPIKEISNSCTTCKISDDKYYIVAQKIQYEPSINGSTPYYIGFYQYQPVLPYLPMSIKTIEQIPFQTVNGAYVGGKLINSEKYIKYNNSNLYWHPHAIETTEYLPYAWSLPNDPPVYNGKIITRTYYPQDLIRNTSCVSGNCPTDNSQVGGKFSIYKYMVDNNIILPVIQGEMNDYSKPKLKENVYIKDSSSGNLLKIGKSRESLLDSNFTLDNPSLATVEEKENFQLYDNLGNLLQSTRSDGIPTTIIYGYKQTLPIAVIKGATYSQIMQIFGLPTTSTGYLTLDIVAKSNSDIDLNSEQILINALDVLRKNTSLSGYQITTYTYDPLIGVTSVTSPSGIREIYVYDTTNRLKEIRQQEKDSAGNIVYKTVKELKYNYKN